MELDPLDGSSLIMLGQYYGRIGEAEKAYFKYERAANVEEFEANAKVYQNYSRRIWKPQKNPDCRFSKRRSPLYDPTENTIVLKLDSPLERGGPIAASCS